MINDFGLFPTLPGLGWSVTKTATFQTRVQRAVSGRELRALDYIYPLWQFSLVYDFLRDALQPTGVAEMRALLGFYLNCNGAFRTFLYQDPTDFVVIGQNIGTGTGANPVFQLGRSLSGFFEPVAQIDNSSLKVYLNGGLQSPLAYSIGDWGVLTFAVPPPAAVAVTADFVYYFRCRFISDSYPFEQLMTNLFTLKKFDFISVHR